MKKLLILTGSNKEIVLAWELFLRPLFLNEDILIVSPQEVSIILSETELGDKEVKETIPYEDNFYLVIKNFEKFKEDYFKKWDIVIVFGTVAKDSLDSYDAVIGMGYTYEKDGLSLKGVNSDLPEDLLNVGIEVTTPNDAPAILYDRKEIVYFLKKFVEVSRKELKEQKDAE